MPASTGILRRWNECGTPVLLGPRLSYFWFGNRRGWSTSDFLGSAKKSQQTGCPRWMIVINCPQTWNFSLVLSPNYSVLCDCCRVYKKPSAEQRASQFWWLWTRVCLKPVAIYHLFWNKASMWLFKCFLLMATVWQRPRLPPLLLPGHFTQLLSVSQCNLYSPDRLSTEWGSRERGNGNRKSNFKNQVRTIREKTEKCTFKATANSLEY